MSTTGAILVWPPWFVGPPSFAIGPRAFRRAAPKDGPGRAARGESVSRFPRSSADLREGRVEHRAHHVLVVVPARDAPPLLRRRVLASECERVQKRLPVSDRDPTLAVRTPEGDANHDRARHLRQSFIRMRPSTHYFVHSKHLQTLGTVTRTSVAEARR